MNSIRLSRAFIIATLFTGAASLFSPRAFAGSCCGGGGGATLVLPKFYQSMVDLSFDFEKYDGFWNANGEYTRDPEGSDLLQERLNFGYARRLALRWQASVAVPYVWNNNTYSSGPSRTEGLGDTSLNLWYEALDDNSAWRIREPKDLIPSVTIGPSLLVPTGISPYDDVGSDSDVTGRGFYRLDGNVLISKTLHPWSASLSLSYGTYLDRLVNREIPHRYVAPYRMKLGNRTSASVSLGYIYYIGTAGDTLTGTASFSHLQEEDTTISGHRQPNSGIQKNAIGGSIAYSSTDSNWIVRSSWSHAIRQNGWGENFPTTDIYTVGVSYGFR